MFENLEKKTFSAIKRKQAGRKKILFLNSFYFPIGNVFVKHVFRLSLFALEIAYFFAIVINICANLSPSTFFFHMSYLHG